MDGVVKKNREFLKNTLTLMSGTVLVQGLTVIISPVLTRLYSPEDMGIYSVIVSISTVLSSIACLRLSAAIILPEEERDSENLFTLAILSATAVSSIALVAILLLKDYLAALFEQDMAYFIYLIPINCFFTSAALSLGSWHRRQKHFRLIAASQVTTYITILVTQLLLGLSVFSISGGMVLGNTFGHIIGALPLAIGAITLYRHSVNSVSFKHMKAMLIRYKEFPLKNTFSALMNTLSMALPSIMLASYYSADITGYYALSFRVLSLPVSIIGGALGQVFYTEAAEARRNGTLKKLTVDMYIRLVKLGVTPFLLIIIAAPALFGFIFGTAWEAAGNYVRIMGAWILVSFVQSALSSIYNVLEKHSALLIYNVTLLLSRFAILLCGGLLLSPDMTILVYSITGTAIAFGSLFVILNWVGCPIGETIGIFIKHLLKSMPFVLPVLAIALFVPNNLFAAIAAVASGIVFLLVTGKKLLGALIKKSSA